MSRLDDLRARLARLNERVDSLEYRRSQSTSSTERGTLTGELSSARELRDVVAATIEEAEDLAAHRKEAFEERRAAAVRAAPGVLTEVERHARAFDRALADAAESLEAVDAALAKLAPLADGGLRRWFRPRDALGASPLGRLVGQPRPEGSSNRGLADQHRTSLEPSVRDAIASLKREEAA